MTGKVSPPYSPDAIKATDSGNSFLTADGLILKRVTSLKLQSGTTVTGSWSTAFPHNVIAIWATNAQVGFGSRQAISCTTHGLGGYEVCQYNDAGADCIMNVYAIGY